MIPTVAITIALHHEEGECVEALLHRPLEDPLEDLSSTLRMLVVLDVREKVGTLVVKIATMKLDQRAFHL